MNGEADHAVSFCIVAVSSGLSSCTSRRKVLTELASHPHSAWVFAFQGADQNLSAFLIARPNTARILPRLPARNHCARPASHPHSAWVFALQGADQNLSAF